MADTTKSLFVDEYLKRLQYSGSVLPNLETLKKLHHSHMLAIPFENLNNIKKEEYSKTKQQLFEKIIQGQRGGLCFELNALFGFLLQELGFEVVIYSGDVFISENDSFSSQDHLIPTVDLNGERWLVDVGFGYATTWPLRLVADTIQDGGNRFYRFKEVNVDGDVLQYELQVSGGGQDLHDSPVAKKDNADLSNWTCFYRFTTEPRSLSYFDESRDDILRNPESAFNQGLLCTITRPWGRITLSRRKLIKTYIDEEKMVTKDEEVLENEEAVWHTLEKEFGVKYN